MTRRIRIRTLPVPPGRLPKGQDTIVELVAEDGSAERLEGVAGLSVRVDVDNRRSLVEVRLRMVTAELDVEGIDASAFQDDEDTRG